MRTIYYVMLLLAGLTGLAANPAETFSKQVLGLLREHCVDCHGGAKPKAKLDLSSARTLEEIERQGPLWFRVMERVESGEMPPKEEGVLPKAARDGIVSWVRGDVASHLKDLQRREGRSQLRRLSRNEYANTVEDLFGIRPPVVRMMPPDGRVDGYDKVRAAVPFSAALTEAHLKMAESVVGQMFEVRSTRESFWLYAKESEQSKGHLLVLPDGWRVSFNSDTNSGPVGSMRREDGTVAGHSGGKKPGMHRLKIHAYGYQTDKPLPVGIYTGHTSAYPQLIQLVKVIEVPPGSPSVVEADVYLRSTKDSDVGVTDGIRLIPFGLGVPVPKNSQASELGKGKPGLALNSIEVEELDDWLPGQKLMFEGMPDEIMTLLKNRAPLRKGRDSVESLVGAVRDTLVRVGGRLFRRDLNPDEVAARVGRFTAALEAGVKPSDAYLEEVVSMMTAPDFLSLPEQPGPLSDFALASRLSYFLWSSAPDEELLAVARKGALRVSENLRLQVERMLKDRRADRFITDFTDQWLGLWGIDNTTPDKDLYPEYDEYLKVSSLAETRESFRRIVADNRSVRDFVAPASLFLNDRLASHYGVEASAGVAVREVKLPAGLPFGGFWTQASVMKVTANGTMTSPIKRGVWMSERLLGLKIPPPPPVEGIEPDIRGAKTFREQLDLHRRGTCSVCHAKFDPYGFALESFDVMGQYRTAYRVQDEEVSKLTGAARANRQRWRDGLPVDSTGTIPSGESFSDIKGLRQLMAGNPELLAKGFVRHLLTYSTGEPASPLDEPVVEAIVREAAKSKHGVRSLIHGVVQSEIFRSK
jgi:mono/diheme cytochrome c family protein